MKTLGILFLSLLLLVSGENQPSDQSSVGPLASITQRIARWFWPNKDNNQQQPLTNHVRSSHYYAQERAKHQKNKDCSPCNAIPWIPIARAVHTVPATYSDNGQQYSFHLPTISLAAIPLVSNHYGQPNPEYGPPKPEYGPPKPEYGPPKPEYGPPKPEYGPPKTEYGPPKPEYGPPKQEYGPPKKEYGPSKSESGLPNPELGLPKLEYGPPKPEYGPPKPEYGPPKTEYGPPKHEYGPPKPEYGPPKTEYEPPKPEYGPPKPAYGLPKHEPPKTYYGPPNPSYGPPKQEYGPPKTEYGPSNPDSGLPNTEYGPPKPEYGPPNPDHGPPNTEYEQSKPEYGPPKPEYGPPKYEPPKTDYGPPNPAYGPPKPNFRNPKPDHIPPKLANAPPKPVFGLSFRPFKQEFGHLKPHYGPPKPEYGPSLVEPAPPNHEYGLPNNQHNPPSGGTIPGPKYLPPPIKLLGPPIPVSPQKNTYGPPKNHYGPPRFNILPISHGLSSNSYIPPNGPEVALSQPKPSQLRLPGPTQQTTLENTATGSTSYQQFLSPPPMKGQHYSSFMKPMLFPELGFNPQLPLAEVQNFGKPNNEHTKLHSNVVLTIQESDICSRCPPSGPDLSHRDAGLEPLKNGVADFGQLPLSDSAHEASSVTVSHLASSTKRPSISQQTSDATQVFVTKSIPVSEYLSSIEYPMQIIQAPILDVPDLPKYVDLGYHTFNQHLYNQYHDNEKSSSLIKSVTTNLNYIPRDPKENKLTDSQRDATLVLNDATLRNPQVDFDKNSTAYGAETSEVPTSHTKQSQSSPQPFVHHSSSTPKPRQVHQIIIPYVRDSPQARKVPPPAENPDLSAVYLNRDVTAPDNGQSTNINYPLTATGSENLESVHIPHLLNSLPPDVMNKLLELGFSKEEPGKSNLQHVVSDNIQALLQGEEDTVDFARLQKNIDTWTVEGYGKRETIPQQNSKVIPGEYLTTPATEEETKPSSSDHDMSASQLQPVTFKVQNGKNSEDDGVLIHEVNGWSLAETKLKTATEQTLTTRPWEKTAISISPLTREKVYVVTPLTTFPLSLDNSTQSTPRNTSTITRDEATTQPTTTKADANTEASKRKDIEEEIAATVKYLGSAANFSKSSPQLT